MRLKEGLSTDPKSVRGNVSSVEIPRYINIESRKEKDEEEDLNENEVENDFITNGIQNLRLDSSHSDILGQSDGEEEADDEGEDEEEEKDDDNDEDFSPDMVAKSPSRNKEQLKTKLRAEISPFPQSQIHQRRFLYNNNTVGDVTVDITHGFDSIIEPANNDLIPVTVSEYNETEPSLEDFFNSITPEEYRQLQMLTNSILDSSSSSQIISSSTDDLSSSSSSSLNNSIPTNKIQPPGVSTTIVNTSHETDISYATPSPVDSSYGTMSPSSTLYSPNPNIQTPKHEMNIISSAESETSLSSTIYDDPITSNDIYFPETSTGWMSTTLTTINIPSPPFVQQNVTNIPPITSDNAVNMVPTVQRTQNISNNLIGGDLTNISFPAPPTVCCVIPNKPNKVTNIQKMLDLQKQQPINVMNNFRRYYSLPCDEPKEFTNLLPVKTNGSTRGVLNIKPVGITVSEIDLHIPGAERLQKYLLIDDKEVAWIVVCEEKEADINASNEQNQTKLMQTLQQKPGKQFLEKIFTRVQRIKKEERRGLLKQRDILGHTALYMAAMMNNNNPLLARFIADTYVELKMDPDELYGEDGNSLLHLIAGANDNYAKVLAELLSVTQPDGVKAFNINRKNKKSLTPLHIAAQTHSPNTSTLAITKLLVKHGAQISVQDGNENTCLHLAIEAHSDPIYIKALLQSTYASQCINLVNNKGDTALHIISKKNNIPYNRQKEVVNQLITSGASHNIHNEGGYLALSLVSQERKPDIKNLFNKKSTNNSKYFINVRI